MTHNVGAMITWSLFASEAMTADEFHEAYPQERKIEALDERIERSGETYDIDVTNDNV